MELVMTMTIQEAMKNKGITRYQLSKTGGIPWATLADIYSGRTKLSRCSGSTLMKLSKALDLSREQLLALEVERKRPPEGAECQESGLPADLQKAIREYLEGERTKSKHLDCLWDELYGSINANQWGGEISPAQADSLRHKYLFSDETGYKDLSSEKSQTAGE